MQITEFKSVVTAFADPGTDLVFQRDQILLSINGELLAASLATQSGDVYVDEGSGPIPANRWVIERLARLPLLAARLRETVAPTPHFVTPSASLLPTLEVGPGGEPQSTDDAFTTTVGAIDKRSPLETTVLYVTSDAGEGKTSLINHLTHWQAERFSKKQSDWLLVPIPLGGRHFLRFDDVTVGVLQNRYRFPFLYYESFLALVQMGVIVPAFDGFEEMFVEGSSGEALSAMGVLVESLDSRGAIVVAARKAYFEFENLHMQERLFDTVRTHSVGFAKLELQRWGQSQFVEYCRNRMLPNGEDVYEKVRERLGPDHALLTRAVLVKRLVDVAVTSPSLDVFVERIQKSGTDYFSVFVRSIIEREANEKWIDRSGQRDVGAALLSVEEHCELLAQVALSMWESRVDYLKLDALDFVAEYFCELRHKSGMVGQQIKERIRGHALLVASPNSAQAVEFDHDEFRLYFLGEAVARQLRSLDERAKADIVSTFRRGALPRQAQHAAIRAILRDGPNVSDVVRFLLELGRMDSHASYAHENSSDIVIRLLGKGDVRGIEVRGMAFGPDALRGRLLKDVTFTDCVFSATSLEGTHFEEVRFRNCKFGEIRLFDSTQMDAVSVADCSIPELFLMERRQTYWVPNEIRSILEHAGMTFEGMPPVRPMTTIPLADGEVADLRRLCGFLMRSTHISERFVRLKLGARAQHFLDETVPQLLRRGVLVEIGNRGAGMQRRFRLGVPIAEVNAALSTSGDSFSRFLNRVGTQ